MNPTDGRTMPSRRAFLGAGGATVLITTSVVGCDLLSTEPKGRSEGGGGGGGAGRDRANGPEAPSLAERVKAGELPPVEERLPSNPLVVEPLESVGVYGGTWGGAVGNPDAGYLYMNFGYDGLVRWDRDWQEIVPNLAESFDIEGDGRAYTFHLREGVKWSDGEPFTTEDIAFAYNDILRNEEIYPDFPTWLLDNTGEPAEFEQVDEYTFRLVFSEANGLFLRRLAGYDGALHLTALPRHFFEQFHAKYNPDADQLARDEGFDSWPDLILARGAAGLADLGWWQTTGIPTLAAWMTVEPIESGMRFVGERNPYYWKVDTESSQLPYIDRVTVEVIQDPQVAVLQGSEGRYSLLPDEFTAVREKPAYARSRETGNYDFIDVQYSNMNDCILLLNLSHPDPQLREVFQNKDFRIGLSYAINRQEIIDTVLQRQGEPWQISPLEDSAFYDEQLAQQYTEYDVDLANQHLDAAGYTERGRNGIRLRPDGKPIRFTLNVRIDSIATWADTAQLIKGYWREVGVDIAVNTGSSELILAQVDANKHDAIMDDGYPGMDDTMIDPIWYFPWNASCQWAIAWGQWYASKGATGEEPTEPVRRQMELYDEIKATADEERQFELFREILAIARDEFFVIGTSKPMGGYTIARNDFHNVPRSIRHGIAYPSPGHLQPEQFYLSGSN